MADIKRDEGSGRLKLAPDITSFRAVKQQILDLLVDGDNTRKIIFVCEEIFSNIVNYSGADSVYFSGSRSGNTYSVTFEDNGDYFDPATAKLREKSFEELDTGGMGIKLARQYSRNMSYNRIGEWNHLRIEFDTGGRG